MWLAVCCDGPSKHIYLNRVCRLEIFISSSGGAVASARPTTQIRRNGGTIRRDGSNLINFAAMRTLNDIWQLCRHTVLVTGGNADAVIVLSKKNLLLADASEIS